MFAATPAQAAASNIVLFEGKTVAGIAYDGSGGVPIAKVAVLLAHDLGALTGQAPRVTQGLEGQSGTTVVIGLASAPAIANLLAKNGISAAPIAGKWETYGRAVVPAPWDPGKKILLIFGSDVRGTIYGVIDLTREMGVSAWEWWADVAIRRVDNITIDGATRYSREPSVKYRAIFLNDEDFGLFPWASKTFDPKLGDIGPKTYARVFELLWRLKANTIWPAMHNITTPFNQIAGNPEMARDYAIVHATSHAEPMLRNNVREWNEKTMGPFDYVANKANMLAYWDTRAKESKDFENIYTVGLRGIHDSPMVGVEGAAAQARVLSDVISEQRGILAKELGRPADTIPQAFTAYKEVLEAYDAGLKLPGDITITWPDDNFGYIRRLGDVEERARPGGAGIYYHISYWGPPTSYLWLATTHPALLWEEMNKAYRFNARRIWIVNVGDLKPGEYLTQLFLDIAFDSDAFQSVADVRAHLKRWAAVNFGDAHSGEIADLLWRYYDLAFERKPEFMGWDETYPTTVLRETAYDIFDFGDENARRLAAYREIEGRADALYRALPTDTRAAFYQLVDYPVDAAAEINARVLDLDKSIAYGLERRASANSYSVEAKDAEDALRAQEHFYNDVNADGKWRGMMDIAPHKLPLYATPALPTWKGLDDKSCAVQTEGGAFYEGGGATPDLPAFHRELKQARYVDVFLKSPTSTKWSASTSDPWIKLDRRGGTLSSTNAYEQRILVTIDWSRTASASSGKITITCDSASTPLPIGVSLAPANAISNVSFIESDRIVSMYATHADALSGPWELLDGLGHTGASLRSKLDLASAPEGARGGSRYPTALYRFATVTNDDKATLKIIALPTLPITRTNGLRLAVSVDDGAPAVLDLKSAEFSEEWRRNVLTNSAIGKIANLRLAAGAHTLKITALDPGIVLDRIEIDFTGAPKAYSPVPETRIGS